MAKIAILLLICLLAYTRAGIRDNVAATIPGEFEVDISVDLDGTTTDQKISISDKYNAAKNVQTISYYQIRIGNQVENNYFNY